MQSTRRHPRVQFAARRYRAAVEELQRACGGMAGPPVDRARRQLEHAVGQVLHHRGVKLTTAPGGTLAQTLAVVLQAAVGTAPDEDRLRQICRRVRDDVEAEVAGLAALDKSLR